jgi:maleylacetoacetate isomerase
MIARRSHAARTGSKAFRRRMPTLYTYFRSSAAFRVRIALNLKGLDYEAVPVHLLKGGGEHMQAEYRAMNPQQLVPSFAVGGEVLTQSLAIIEYLDETVPEPALLPPSPLDRAWVRSVSLAVACDIHPLNNLRVLRYLVRDLGIPEAQKDDWYRHWCKVGLEAIEAQVARRAGRFCLGDRVTLADVCLVPQMFNARRLNTDLAACPTLVAITDRCMQLPAFEAAQPSRQPDAE